MNTGNIVDSWEKARDACFDFDDGNYTLPVPNSQEYNDYVSSLINGNFEIPLGFSDELEEGNWINIYTS